MLKKKLSDGILAVLRPLYNSNMAKVSIVKWSHNLIFVDGNPFFDYPMILKLHKNRKFSKILGMPEMTLLATKINF